MLPDGLVNMAGAHLFSDDCASLATHLVRLVNPLPIEALHEIARYSDQAPLRLMMIQLLEQAYTGPTPGMLWDLEFERSARFVAQDPEPSIRVHGVQAAIRVHRERGATLLLDSLLMEKDPDVRRDLERFKMELAGVKPLDRPSREELSVHDFDFHYVVDDVSEATWASLSQWAPRDPSASQPVFHGPDSQDAILLVEHEEEHGITHVRVTGEEASLLVLEAAKRMHLVPRHVLIAAARSALEEQARCRALWQLAVTSLGPAREEIEKLLSSAEEGDPSAAVRSEARRAHEYLRAHA
ncbi:MAG TPA: hypothetical protein VFK05_06145 [Polyangiaceae bacterium]|nr:hypothetical protein [Polyangiaceae bacterium]